MAEKNRLLSCHLLVVAHTMNLMALKSEQGGSKKSEQWLYLKILFIFHFAELCNRKGKYNFQQPIFRANVGGTIFFDVEEHNPYKVAKIYEESDNYIIYAVEPVHHGMACLLYTSDAADEEDSVDLGGRRII